MKTVEEKTVEEKTIEEKRKNEKKIMTDMVGIYCHGQHRSKRGTLCPECQVLLNYAHLRTDNCPFMETKTFCSACRVHCYSREMQEKIRMVMRYAGPRMMYVHPVSAVRHIITTLRAKRKAAE